MKKDIKQAIAENNIVLAIDLVIEKNPVMGTFFKNRFEQQQHDSNMGIKSFNELNIERNNLVLEILNFNINEKEEKYYIKYKDINDDNIFALWWAKDDLHLTYKINEAKVFDFASAKEICDSTKEKHYGFYEMYPCTIINNCSECHWIVVAKRDLPS